MTNETALSPQLQAAQELLYQKRAEARAERIRRGLPVDVGQNVGSRAEGVGSCEKDAPVAAAIQQLPAHLGWGSVEYTQAVRRNPAYQPPAPPVPVPPAPIAEPPQTSATPAPPRLPIIKTFAHVLDKIHRSGLDRLGRVWLLLRYLDPQGEGRVALPQARQEFTERGSDLKCLSWKRLRQLLLEGEGLFWRVSPGREWVYYTSEARLACLLGLSVIKGWAIQVPVADLLGDIKEIRAVFHEAFYCGRGDGLTNPITRNVMEMRGSADRRTQRVYEEMRGVEKRSNFATLGLYDQKRWHYVQAAEAAGEQGFGGPAFKFVDFQGILGKNPTKHRRPAHQQHWENIYIMRQIGNSYAGHMLTTKRGRKWTNHKLHHLCKSMHTKGTVEQEDGIPSSRLYYEDSRLARRVLHPETKRLAYVQHEQAPNGKYWEELEWLRVANREEVERDFASRWGGKVAEENLPPWQIRSKASV